MTQAVLSFSSKEVQAGRRVLLEELGEWAAGDTYFKSGMFRPVAVDAGVPAERINYKRLRRQIEYAAPASIERYMRYRDHFVRVQANPASAGAIFGLVAAAAGLGVGIWLFVRGFQGETQVEQVPAPPPLPNYYPGPNGEIITTVGPYGVPLEISQA